MESRKVAKLGRSSVILLFPLFFLLIVFGFIPLVYSIYLSLQGSYVTGGFSLDNFSALGSDSILAEACISTSFFLLAVPLELMLGVGLALLVNSQVANRSIIATILTVPTAVAPLAVAAGWQIIFHDYGIINWALSRIGLPQPGFLTNPWLATLSIILADVWEWSPLVMLVTLAGLSSIPTDLLEAARLDGATLYQRFTGVIMPMLRPALLVAVLIRLVDSVRIFDIFFIATRVRSVMYHIYLTAFVNLNFNYAAAMAVTLSVITLGLVSLANRFFRR